MKPYCTNRTYDIQRWIDIMMLNEKPKNKPFEMSDIELLETYSHYTRLHFRFKEEQEYTAELRAEIMKRMSNHQN